MREQELLDALAKGPGGVQVNISDKGCTVSTRYYPTVVHRGPDIMHAAILVAEHILRMRFTPKVVLDALRDYNEHTERLRV